MWHLGSSGEFKKPVQDCDRYYIGKRRVVVKEADAQVIDARSENDNENQEADGL